MNKSAMVFVTIAVFMVGALYYSKITPTKAVNARITLIPFL